MFPNSQYPSYGIFVKRFCDDLEENNIRYEKVVIHKSEKKIVKFYRYLCFYFMSFFKAVFKRYDYIYIHYGSYSSVGILISQIFKKNNIIVNLHGSDVVAENFKQHIMNKFTKIIVSKSCRIVVPSNYFKEYVCEHFDLSISKVFVFPSSGIDRNVFKPFDSSKRKEFVQAFNLKADKIRIGFISRISEGKGWDTFVDSVKRIDELNLSAKFEFIIVGSGPQEDMMMQKINSLGIDNLFSLFPLLSTENLSKMYNSLNLLVFPTRRSGESLGLVALEAMSCGTPVIATDYAAPADYVKNNYNGFKFDYGSSIDLTEKILLFGELDYTKVSRLRNNAIATAKKFDRQKVKAMQLDIFKDVN